MVGVNHQLDDNVTAAPTLERDGNDRLWRVTDSASHVTTYHFDGLDRVQSLDNGLGIRTYAYVQGSSRPQYLQDPAGTTQTFSYDLAGRLAAVSVQDGKGLSWQGPAVNRLYTYSPLG